MFNYINDTNEDDDYKEVSLDKSINLNRDDILKDINGFLATINVLSSDKRTLIKKFQEEEKKPILNMFSDSKELLLLLSYMEIFLGIEKAMDFKEKFTKVVIENLYYDFKSYDYIFQYYELNDFIGITVKLQLNDSSLIDIAVIDVFNKDIVLLENEKASRINNEIESLNMEIEDLNKREMDLCLAKKNPLYLADGDPIKVLKISTMKNKYQSQIKDDIEKVNIEKNRCYIEIANYKAELSEMELFTTQLLNYQTQLSSKLSSLYGFRNIDIENTEVFETENNKEDFENIVFFN